MRLRCCGEGTTGFEFIAVWGGISRLYKFLCPSSAQTQVHHCRQPHHALKIMCATMEILLHLLTWRKWKCFFVKHMVKWLFMTRQKSSEKRPFTRFHKQFWLAIFSNSDWNLFSTYERDCQMISIHIPTTQKRGPSLQAVYKHSCDVFL